MHNRLILFRFFNSVFKQLLYITNQYYADINVNSVFNCQRILNFTHLMYKILLREIKRVFYPLMILYQIISFIIYSS